MQLSGKQSIQQLFNLQYNQLIVGLYQDLYNYHQKLNLNHTTKNLGVQNKLLVMVFVNLMIKKREVKLDVVAATDIFPLVICFHTLDRVGK